VKTAVGNDAAVHCVGISTTGAVSRDGVVLNANHFDGYSDVSWQDILRSACPRLKRVVTVNDGRASAWAEFGVLQNVQHFAHFVVGTGVGGATVVDGRLVVGDEGFAGYLGHVKVTPGPTPRCSCGETGCVEPLASAAAVARYFEELAPASNDTSQASGLARVVEAARVGDERAVAAFTTAGRWLGVAMSYVVNIINPSVVTIGGGVPLAATAASHLCGGGNPFVSAAAESARQRADRRPAASVEIRAASYGNEAGLIGAAIAAHDECSTD
jgi:glucokinase